MLDKGILHNFRVNTESVVHILSYFCTLFYLKLTNGDCGIRNLALRHLCCLKHVRP